MVGARLASADTASSSGRWPGTSATPGCTSSLTRSTRPTAPRSLKSRTCWPSARPRGARVVGMQDAAGRALALAQEGDGRIGGVALEVAGRGQQPQRPAGGVGYLLRVGLPVGHRRQALLGHASPSRTRACPRRAELLAALGRDVDRPGVADALGIDVLDGAGGAAEQLLQHLRPATCGRRGRRGRAAPPAPAPPPQVGARLRRTAPRPGGRTACSRSRRRGRSPRSPDRSPPAARCRHSARSPTGRDRARR